MRIVLIIALSAVLASCIPVRIAPKFKDHKVMVAKKFKRSLPRETSFIFKDPKDANEFYNYMNTKFQLNHVDVAYNVPFVIEDKTYYLSYKEIGIEDQILNMPLILIDAKMEQEGLVKLFEDDHVSRTGHWYLVLTVYDDNFKNCLKASYLMQPKILEYLKALKQEYLNTQNYEALLFAKK